MSTSNPAIASPIPFAGSVPARAATAPSVDPDAAPQVDPQVLENVLAGRVSVNAAARMSGDPLIAAVLRATAQTLEQGADRKAADIFIDAFACGNVRALGKAFGAQKQAGFAAIGKYILAAEPGFAPDTWDTKSLRAMADALLVRAEAQTVRDILPAALAIVKAGVADKGDSYRNALGTLILYSLSHHRGAERESAATQVADVAPWLVGSFASPWSTSREEIPVLTERVAKVAFARLDSVPSNKDAALQKAMLLQKCSLAWLTPEAVADQIRTAPVSLARYCELENATLEQFVLMAYTMLHDTQNDYGHSTGRVKDLPGFDKYAGKTEAVRHLFEQGLGLSGRSSAAAGRLVSLRCIADKQPKGVGHGLLKTAISAGFREVAAQANPEFKAAIARTMVKLTISAACSNIKASNYPGDAPVKFNEKLDMQAAIDILRSANLSEIVTDPVARSLEERFHYMRALDDEISKTLESSDLAVSSQLALRIAVIDSGAISLGALRRRDLTPDLIGPILASHPERLAEVTHLADFTRLARKFGIPVTIPEEVLTAQAAKKATRTSKTATAVLDAIAAPDAMSAAAAEIDQKPARRRMR